MKQRPSRKLSSNAGFILMPLQAHPGLQHLSLQKTQMDDAAAMRLAEADGNGEIEWQLFQATQDDTLDVLATVDTVFLVSLCVNLWPPYNTLIILLSWKSLHIIKLSFHKLPDNHREASPKWANQNCQLMALEIQVLRSQSLLFSLDLSCNEITDVGAAALLEALEDNNVLLEPWVSRQLWIEWPVVFWCKKNRIYSFIFCLTYIYTQIHN